MGIHERAAKLLALITALAGCPSQPAPALGETAESTPCASGPLITCSDGQVDGCATGVTKEHRCVPGGPGACLDARAALVQCRAGETMTHEGCPGEPYMQRCAAAPASAPQQQPPAPAGTAEPVAPAPAPGAEMLPRVPTSVPEGCINIESVRMRCPAGQHVSTEVCGDPKNRYARCVPD